MKQTLNIALKIGLVIAIGSLLLLVSMGFQEQEPKTIDELIQQKVEERDNSYYESSIARCQKDIWKEADRLVDSILIARARNMINPLDTVNRPDIPDRPEMPEIPIINDSMPIAPILEAKDTITNIIKSPIAKNKKDSLLRGDSLGIGPTIEIPKLKKASN